MISDFSTDPYNFERREAAGAIFAFLEFMSESKFHQKLTEAERESIKLNFGDDDDFHFYLEGYPETQGRKNVINFFKEANNDYLIAFAEFTKKYPRAVTGNPIDPWRSLTAEEAQALVEADPRERRSRHSSVEMTPLMRGARRWSRDFHEAPQKWRNFRFQFVAQSFECFVPKWVIAVTFVTIPTPHILYSTLVLAPTVTDSILYECYHYECYCIVTIIRTTILSEISATMYSYTIVGVELKFICLLYAVKYHGRKHGPSWGTGANQKSLFRNYILSQGTTRTENSLFSRPWLLVKHVNACASITTPK